ncbi:MULTISPECIES: sensor histidine kinase [unclassified Streptomyces]|uniref:sensor histidine kinase n=1 Tax=unclassified Streptomyces TaxID=2593676 RepID=UPI002E81B9C8|nr:sensor histidine kinase [Streptomyces sp. NBC_00589]WTI36145.1 sensor histidine kinase [Streptomyces sp. NBC_00775]WUB30181.1 sensor histidine kinase [Streptomyces sp. NBC_00589]
MTNAVPLEPRASFDRWGPYALLVTGVVAAIISARLVGMGRSEVIASAALVAAGAVLQVWWGRVKRRRPGPSRTGVCLYFLRWALGFVLTWLNPFFAFYAVTGYYTALRELPRRLVMPGLFLTAITMAGSEVGGMPLHGLVIWLGFFLVLAANTGLVVVFTRFNEQEEQRARVQAETIAELGRTNTALQQALDENAALHAQLLVQAREAGVADERRRLAAEIHDTIAQGLTGIIAQLQVVANAPDLTIARTHLGRASALARHSLGEARRSVHNLAPVALADDGLPEALKKTVAEWSERTGVRAEFTVTGTAEQLHEELAATLLRIVQEALSNAARHARATRLGVTLSFLGDEVILDIRDDGRGFDPGALPERTRIGGFGLDGMRARAERIAGTLTIEAEPGHGTAVSARVPLVRDDR